MTNLQITPSICFRRSASSHHTHTCIYINTRNSHKYAKIATTTMEAPQLSFQPDQPGVMDESIVWGYWTHFMGVLILLLLWKFQRLQQNETIHHPSSPTDDAMLKRIVTVDSTVSEDSDGDDNETVNSCSSENIYSDEGERKLHRLVPLSTEEECTRFFAACKHDTGRAHTKLEAYLQWHQDHAAIEETLGLESHPKSDRYDWKIASQVAMIASKEKSGASLARIARVYCDEDGAPICDREGHRMLHIMPGLMNGKTAYPATYALALALFINKKLDRLSSEKITVIIDVRGRKGWANIHPCRQLPFIQSVTKLLLAMFPERLHRCLLFPVPLSGMWIWNLCKVWIDPLTVSKINLLSGEARINSSPPFAQMEAFMTPNIAQMLEDQRNEDLEDE